MKRLPILLTFIIFFCTCTKQKISEEKPKDNILYIKAYEYFDRGKKDSAFFYFNNAKDVFLNQKDSLKAGNCLLLMAMISTDKGDFFGGQEISLNADSYFSKKDKNQYPYLLSNYNNLGLATYNLRDYDNALKFYNLALKYSTNENNRATILNNIGKIYQELSIYSKALAFYNLALKKATNNKILTTRIITNIALAKWLQDPKYNPSKEFLIALKIREEEDDLIGKNSSYAHLADYYSYKNADSTLIYAIKMYEVAKDINSPEDQLQALRTLVRFSPINQTKDYFNRYQNLQDSLLNSRNVSKNQFALIRYESEKRKTDNLLLQKDNTEKKYQIIKREILFVITLLILIAASIIAILWYKKRKQKLELESQNTIRENQLRTSKKVHDVVANGLYRVMTEIENREGIDKEHILDKIDDMYQKSRDISYDKPQTTNSHFSDKLTKLLLAFETETIKVVALGNTVELWEKVTPQVKYEIEHILQELMVNMDKHSQATEVSIKFYKKDKFISIHYNDNGTGLSENVIYNNGLTNTETRIKNISGTITFETIQNKGLEILISFPIH